jgi:hypothetical protein
VGKKLELPNGSVRPVTLIQKLLTFGGTRL